jgi:hypothetical protein
MVRQRLKYHDVDRIEPLGPAEDACGDVVELRAGPEQQAPVQGPAGDLDQSASIGDVAEFSSHTPTEDVKSGQFRQTLWYQRLTEGSWREGKKSG